MPKMTGYEACAQLKEIPETRDIPVVFLSAKGQEAEIQQGIDVGAIEFILKPFAPDELTVKVRNILERLKKR
jgi:two-component system alkaline phosphatase synthesis response regulator PhoP